MPSQGSNISGLPVDPRSPRSKGQGLVARWAVAQRIRDVAVNVVGTHLQNLVIPQRVALVAAEGAPELSAERPVWCGVGTKSSASAEGPGAPMSSTVVPCLSAAGPTIIAIKVEVVSIVSGVPNCALHVAIGRSVVAHRRCTGRCRSSDEQRNRSFNGPSNHPSRISRGTTRGIRVGVGDGWGRRRENGGRDDCPAGPSTQVPPAPPSVQMAVPGLAAKAAAVFTVLGTGREGGGPGARKATPLVVPSAREVSRVRTATSSTPPPACTASTGDAAAAAGDKLPVELSPPSQQTRFADPIPHFYQRRGGTGGPIVPLG